MEAVIFEIVAFVSVMAVYAVIQAVFNSVLSAGQVLIRRCVRRR